MAQASYTGPYPQQCLLYMDFPAKPSAILLATDLSARSDRAQARAIQLAQYWQAKLVVAVAMSHDVLLARPNAAQEEADDAHAAAPSPKDLLLQQAREVFADAGVPVDVVVEIGFPGPVAAETAQRHGCGLIITGNSRSEAVMRMDPGSTLRWLARHASVPVLAVNQRVRAPYQQITLASDYSKDASDALRLCSRWFADATRRTLLHGYTIPLATLALNDAPREQALSVLQQQAKQQASDYLASTLDQADSGWTSAIRAGGPVRLLREHARETPTDLTVIASHGRTALMDKLMGSVAERLLETVSTDLLIVRPQRS